MAPSNNSYSTGAGKCLVIKIKKQKESGIFLCLLLSRTNPEKEVEGFGKRDRWKGGVSSRELSLVKFVCSYKDLDMHTHNVSILCQCSWGAFMFTCSLHAHLMSCLLHKRNLLLFSRIEFWLLNKMGSCLYILCIGTPEFQKSQSKR